MAAYKVTWIAENLAVAQAPMDYDALRTVRDMGINAIVNLCGEYCDLHTIEQEFGFEVYYLPVDDGCAPGAEELEKALDWLDEAIYLGKKVLVHCRFGIGRTGTFVTSYLLRRGFGHKLAKRKLKHSRSAPATFDQWWFLRKYGKSAGQLTLREPSLEGRGLVDLRPYFSEYERLVAQADSAFQSAASCLPNLQSCGAGTDDCCSRYFHLQLIEAAYLNHHLNRILPREERLAAINRSVGMGKMACLPSGQSSGGLEEAKDGGQGVDWENSYTCPLSVDGKCIVYPFRPITCRVYGIPMIYQGRVVLPGAAEELLDRLEMMLNLDRLNEALHQISQRVFVALSSLPLSDRSLVFPITRVVSGKFVEDYFAFLMRMPGSELPA